MASRACTTSSSASSTGCSRPRRSKPATAPSRRRAPTGHRRAARKIRIYIAQAPTISSNVLDSSSVSGSGSGSMVSRKRHYGREGRLELREHVGVDRRHDAAPARCVIAAHRLEIHRLHRCAGRLQFLQQIVGQNRLRHGAQQVRACVEDADGDVEDRLRAWRERRRPRSRCRPQRPAGWPTRVSPPIGEALNAVRMLAHRVEGVPPG